MTPTRLAALSLVLLAAACSGGASDQADSTPTSTTPSTVTTPPTPSTPAPVTVTKTESPLTDEGRQTVPKWADTIRGVTDYFDGVPDQLMVRLARAQCEVLRQGIPLERVISGMTNTGITRQDAGLFLVGAEAGYCLDVLR